MLREEREKAQVSLGSVDEDFLSPKNVGRGAAMKEGKKWKAKVKPVPEEEREQMEKQKNLRIFCL